MKNLNEIADWLESGKYQCLPPHTQKVNGYITTLRRLAEKPPNIFDRVMAEEPTVKLKDLYTSKPYGASLKIKEILVEEGADDRLPLDLNELDASIFNCVVDDLLSVPPFEEMFPDLCGFTMKSLHELDVIIFNEGEKCPGCTWRKHKPSKGFINAVKRLFK